ncbi:hypothetical protein E3P92_01242 [Wallemia ichthyophaga]|nr:hypothetical protein E3P91_00949 [Wallemia ichthyophaga]TIB16795.1 hypothetical protein E3P92_01242 [Wallemia ichthyophaga]TIB64542.1 hypothetical protein E3P78_01099 [Wallemia ichthyophaga]
MARKRSHASKKSNSVKDPKQDSIPMDSEDEFHHQNDRIDFGHNSPSDDDSDNEEEVYGLKGVDDEDEDDNDDDDDDDDVDMGDYQDVPDDNINLDHTNDNSDHSDNSEENSDDASKLKSWGSRQSAYYSRQDENESDDDEDTEQNRKLEQEEALKLQKSSRQDWSWDDVKDIGGVVEDEGNQDTAVDLDEPEDNTAYIDTSDLSHSDKLALLQKTSPETLALLTDYEDILSKLRETEEFIAKRKKEDINHPALGLLYVYHQTLLTYAPLLTYFLCLRASPAYAHDRIKLLQHPVLNRMVTLREGLSRMEDLGFGPGDEQAIPEDDEEDQQDIRNMVREWAAHKQDDVDDDVDNSLEQGELEGLMVDESENVAPPKKDKKDKKKSKKNSSNNSNLIHQVDESAFEYKPSTSKSNKKDLQRNTDDDYLGEADTLSTLDAESKKKNKKSLQFHTARIAKTDNRRSAASKQRQSGDDDVPYRERKKARLEKGGKSAEGDELDGGEWTAQDEATRRQIMNEDEGLGDGGDGGDGDDYYNLVRQSKKAKKEAKKEEYDDARWKNRVDYVDESGVDGPRSLPRDIALNKAVTRARSFKHSKLNRNPRLKKRIRFDQAQKKIKSMKPVYQGGQEGQYEGERSGITRNVKSTKL